MDIIKYMRVRSRRNPCKTVIKRSVDKITVQKQGELLMYGRGKETYIVLDLKLIKGEHISREMTMDDKSCHLRIRRRPSEAKGCSTRQDYIVQCSNLSPSVPSDAFPISFSHYIYQTFRLQSQTFS